MLLRQRLRHQNLLLSPLLPPRQRSRRPKQRLRLRHHVPARPHRAPVLRVRLVLAQVITHLLQARGWVALIATLSQAPQGPVQAVHAQGHRVQVVRVRLVPVRVITRSQPTRACAAAVPVPEDRVLVVPALVVLAAVPVPVAHAQPQALCPVVQHLLKVAQPAVQVGAAVPVAPVAVLQEPADPDQHKLVVPHLVVAHQVVALDVAAPQVLSAAPVVSLHGDGSRSGRSALNLSRCKLRHWAESPYLGVPVTP